MRRKNEGVKRLGRHAENLEIVSNEMTKSVGVGTSFAGAK